MLEMYVPCYTAVSFNFDKSYIGMEKSVCSGLILQLFFVLEGHTNVML